MPYRLLADLVVLIHFGFVLLVIFGGLLVLLDRRWLWVHLPVVAWGVAIEVIGFICPLTPLENALRRRAGEAGYEGGFVEHYVMPVLYPPGLDRQTQFLLAGLVIGINAVIYGWVAWRLRRRRPAGGRDSG